MFDTKLGLADFDPQLWKSMQEESVRQEEHIELIASENYTSPQVMAAQGSVLTNKYAEGYPGKRYYGGCEHIDEVEGLAITRIKEIFKADFANVQPHSGSQANAAVYQALIKPGDRVVGMSLADGGHLTHGAAPSFSGKNYDVVQYGINSDTGYLDYDVVADIVKKHKPQLLVAGFSAYSRIIDWQTFRDIADSVGAYLMIDIAHPAGLCATGLYPNPINHADVVTSTTHKTLRGPRGGLILTQQEDLIKKLNSAIFPGIQGGPLCHVMAAKAVAFKEALEEEFVDYQQSVITNARTMANRLMQRGFQVVSDGTDNHLMLVSLIDKDYNGKQAEEILGRVNITVNKNAVPNDPESPFITSGIRIGTPAITTRGFGVEQSAVLANWICDVLEDQSESTIMNIKSQVKQLCEEFPVYSSR